MKRVILALALMMPAAAFAQGYGDPYGQSSYGQSAYQSNQPTYQQPPPPTFEQSHPQWAQPSYQQPQQDHNFGAGAGSGPIVSQYGGATGGMCFGIYCR